MKRFSPLKVGTATTALALAFGMMAVPASAQEQKYINLCHLEGVSQQVIAKIRERADFADLLQQVNAVCPASAVMLTTGATATVAGPGANNDGGDGHGFSDVSDTTPAGTSNDLTGFTGKNEAGV